MASGDLMFSRAVDGECEVPCCVKCGVADFGDTLIGDNSGTITCVCSDEGQIEIRDEDRPTHFEMTSVDETHWESALVGSAKVYTGGECETLTEAGDGQFRGEAFCIETGPNAGKIGFVIR